VSGLTLTYDGQIVGGFATVLEAVEHWAAYRDSTDGGVVRRDGLIVARISYNGRVSPVAVRP
jgi:hypothetical protein